MHTTQIHNTISFSVLLFSVHAPYNYADFSKNLSPLASHRMRRKNLIASKNELILCIFRKEDQPGTPSPGQEERTQDSTQGDANDSSNDDTQYAALVLSLDFEILFHVSDLVQCIKCSVTRHANEKYI